MRLSHIFFFGLQTLKPHPFSKFVLSRLVSVQSPTLNFSSWYNIIFKLIINKIYYMITYKWMLISCDYVCKTNNIYYI